MNDKAVYCGMNPRPTDHAIGIAFWIILPIYLAWCCFFG